MKNSLSLLEPAYNNTWSTQSIKDWNESNIENHIFDHAKNHQGFDEKSHEKIQANFKLELSVGNNS